MTNEKTAIAVVGLGSIARKAHLPVLAAHPGVAITGLASRTGSQVEQLASQYRLPLTARTFAEILAAKPQAAYLLSPTAAHAVDASARTGRLLMVGFNRRFAPAYRRAKEHARPGLVAATVQGPDTLVHLSQTYGAGAATERVELHGQGLTVVVEDLERLTIRERGVERVEPLFGSWTSTLEKRGIGPELEHFLTCLHTGQTPETSGAEALATQQLAEAILGAGGVA